MSNEINQELLDSILLVIPKSADQAIAAADIFRLAKFSESAKDINALLSQLVKEGKIQRATKTEANKTPHYVYWREDQQAIKTYGDLLKKHTYTSSPELNQSLRDVLSDKAIPGRKEVLRAKVESTAGATPQQQANTKPMPMATLKPCTTYSLITSKGQIDLFSQIGNEWNGMIELRNPAGDCIILSKVETELSTPNSQALEKIAGFDEQHYSVIKCSPSLVELFV